MLAAASQPALFPGFDPMLLLVLNLVGTFVFGLSGGLAAVHAKLDIFGVLVLAMAAAFAGGITRDLLIGIPPSTFRDLRYLAVAAGAGAVTFLASESIGRHERSMNIFDAAGLALFCVTGAATALQHHVGPAEAIILGAITGIGGGMLRDILRGEMPVVLREGLYATPALCGAAVVVGAFEAGTHGPAFPIIGAAVCFSIRLAGIQWDINEPAPSTDS
jgi:uncharacterized membrane protein YeiH